MGRLIDADVVWRKLQYRLKRYGNEHMSEKFKEMLDSIPTAYDVDKVVEEVAEKAERYCKVVGCEHCYTDCDHYILMQSVAASIAKGGVEHG